MYVNPCQLMPGDFFSYFVMFIEDHSTYDYAYWMKFKYETLKKFKKFKLEVEKQLGKVLSH